MIGECCSCGETVEIVGSLRRDPAFPLCASCCDEDYRDDFDPELDDEDEPDDPNWPADEEAFIERYRERKYKVAD